MPPQSEKGSAILVLGESHSSAVARAVSDAAIEDFVAIDVRDTASGAKVDHRAFTGYRPRHLVLAFGGTEYNIIGLIEAEPRFDFVWPPFYHVDTDRQIIPSAIIEQLIEHKVAKSVKRALQVRQTFNCTVHALAPPPPFLELDDQAKLPMAFQPLLAAGVAPAHLRRKLYAVQCQTMARLYGEHGIDLIPAPVTAQDGDGFLLRSFWNRDPTHGNRAYGRLVVDYLKDYLHD